MASVISASAMYCPDCHMAFRDSKLLHKHRQRFCPGLTRERSPTSGNHRKEHSSSGIRDDIQRLEMRVAEALSKNKQSTDEDNFWKLRQKQIEDLDQTHQVRLAELRERDRQLAGERTKLQGNMGSLGMLGIIQALRPRTPPPPPPQMPPPTIIPPSQPFIIPPNPPPPPAAPVIIEPPPAQPPQIITIASGGGPTYPPLPPPPPIIHPPANVTQGPSIDPTHLLLLQQIRDTDAAHQMGMRDLQVALKQIEENSRKTTPPPVIIPSPPPPILLPRPEPPIIINPPAVKPPPTVITMPPPPPPPAPFMYIGGAGSLIGEVQSLRHAYMSSGGQDGEMLFALAQLEREARDLGRSNTAKTKRPRRTHKSRTATGKLDFTLRSIEIENERLSREINLLQQQSMQFNVNSRASDDLERQHAGYLRKIAQLERESNNMKMELNHTDTRNRHAALTMSDSDLKKDVQPDYQPERERVVVVSNCPHGGQCAHCNNGIQEMPMFADKVVPAPSFKPVVGPSIDFPPLYPDQTETSAAGMYIFWDFVIGLPPETTALRLHSALYNDTYALGRPTSLPVFYTQQLPESNFFPYNMRVAMMSMMQQIPGCEPSADLSVIIEVHLSIASGPLTSKAWVKLDLFDEHLRVKSGRWRVALRRVPVETSLSTADLSSLNQYNRAELFFRLATHNQAQVEAKQKMNPNYANYYNYLRPTIKLTGSPRR